MTEQSTPGEEQPKTRTRSWYDEQGYYNIVVNAHVKRKWSKQDAAELAKLLAEQERLRTQE